MSLIFMDGFDDGLYATRWDRNSYGVPTASSQNRFGLAIRGTNFSDRYIRRNIDSADEHATLTVGFWFYMPILPGGVQSNEARHWLQFRSDSGITNHCTMAMDPNGSIRFTNGNGTALGSNSAIVWSATEAHYIEVRAILHDTTGAMTAWVDGTQVLDVTGVDTKNGGTKTVFDAVQIQGIVSSSEEMDDFVITNGAGVAPYNGPLGGVVIETKFPNGNGNYSDFVGSDADSTDNYLLVDEDPTHDSDTTYVESSTDTDRDSYAFENLDAASGEILGVMATAVMRNTGAADNVQVSARISATDYDGPTFAVPAGYGPLDQIWEQSPATAVDWTISEVDGAEFGIENIV